MILSSPKPDFMPCGFDPVVLLDCLWKTTVKLSFPDRLYKNKGRSPDSTRLFERGVTFLEGSDMVIPTSERKNSARL